MTRIIIAIMMTLFLVAESRASTVCEKGYGYRYEAARDSGSDREYVICVEPPRPPLVPELKPPPIAIRFEDHATALPLDSSPVSRTVETASRSCSCEYRLEKTVLFPFDSARVEADSGLSLLAGALKADPSVTGIRIRGFTCDLGPKEYNDRLAMRRAVTVASLFGKSGLQVHEVSGEGKCCYVPGERKLSRRVEISVMRKAEKEKNDEK